MKKPDVIDFMKKNVDRYISKQYSLVGLEDTKIESGIGFYLKPRDHAAIKEKVDNAIE